MNPSTWSAKAQALALLALAAVIAALNTKYSLGLDNRSIIAFGGAGAFAVAHIDHGEPAVPASPAAPSSAAVDAAKATLKAAGVTTLAFVACFALTGCGTLNGLWSDAKAVASDPTVKADVKTLEDAVAKLRADVVAAGHAEGPDLAALAASVAGGNYVGAAVDLLTLSPQLAATGGVVLADGKAVHAALSKLVSDSESAVRLARASAKLNAAPVSTAPVMPPNPQLPPPAR